MMPGFTAEASLYVTNQRYQMLLSTGQSGSLQLAFIWSILGGCFARCAGACPRRPGGEINFDCYWHCLEICGPPVPRVHPDYPI
jgi:hypothetical protein